jgi:hypothetical protein
VDVPDHGPPRPGFEVGAADSLENGDQRRQGRARVRRLTHERRRHAVGANLNTGPPIPNDCQPAQAHSNCRLQYIAAPRSRPRARRPALARIHRRSLSTRPQLFPTNPTLHQLGIIRLRETESCHVLNATVSALRFHLLTRKRPHWLQSRADQRDSSTSVAGRKQRKTARSVPTTAAHSSHPRTSRRSLAQH